ncbi:hypothetical protein GCWU000325_02407 [Alloprevotella tannerae ATCC 51259]|uniref:Uncharacterized protein n=1 Tax=Alloprevotella tannerae ATCC 51259 TaxID=626522 RepID=C9LJJ4_9BACT|nr:hypothetical protein GCWU000325_02407 [Alloprevotella tannerae ATCC 51259]
MSRPRNFFDTPPISAVDDLCAFFASGYATDYKHTNTAFRNSGR